MRFIAGWEVGMKPLPAARKQAWYFHGEIKEAGTTIVGRVCVFRVSTDLYRAGSFR
jgi:hypothetical protein